MSQNSKKSKLLGRLVSVLTHASVPGFICTAVFAWISTQIDPTQSQFRETEPNSLIGLFELIHLKTIDFRFKNRGEHTPHPRVAVLAVDDESIERVGRWPWPRSEIAKLVDHAVESGAKVIGFDAIFSERDPNAASRLLHQSLIRLKSKDQALSEDLEAELRNEISNSNYDRLLSQSIQRNASNVVMGAYFDGVQAGVRQSPVQKLCEATTVKLLPMARYWEKEKIQIKTSEPQSVIPSEIQQQYQDKVQSFLSELEVTRSAEFLNDSPELKNQLIEILRELEIIIPEEMLPYFFTAALLEDHSLLGQILDSQTEWTSINNAISRNQIMVSILRGLQMKDLSLLREQARERLNSYCSVSLTEDDPLLDKEKLTKILGIDEPAIIDELWAERNLKSVKDQIDLLVSVGTQDSFDPLTQFTRTVLNIPDIAQTTLHTGYFNASLDTDGVVRRTYLLAQRGGILIPSLAFKMFLLDQNLQPELKRRIIFDKKMNRPIYEIESLSAKPSDLTAASKMSIELPVDRSGRMMINYAGPQIVFPYIRASSLLESIGDLEVIQRQITENGSVIPSKPTLVDRKEYLKDKLLIFGVTAIAVYDLRQTPFDENFPGVETHANALSNMLSLADQKADRPMTLISAEKEWITWTVAILGILFSALLAWMNSIAGLGLSLATMIGLGVFETQALFNNGIVINSSIVIISLFSNYVLITFYKYFTEERNKRELKGTFAKYVSPAVVDEILRDPENIELGGKKTDLTVMFSDVRGFTTISEKLDPRALSDLLNSYLTPMTELVFSTQGTLDKYMGDAIMAFWGAPISLSDHPSRACLCALKMLVKLEELKAEYRAKGLPEIDIGIGINTGEMSVGNMGSNTVRSYTVMGDAVNLGSRLEGINKEYGTRIIISEFTQARVSHEFITREVDWVRVKGKVQPVRIFELLGHKSDSAHLTSPRLLSLLPHFQVAFAAYHERDFDKALLELKHCLEIMPDDAVSLLYVERIQALRADPPPADWDGVFVMKTK